MVSYTGLRPLGSTLKGMNGAVLWGLMTVALIAFLIWASVAQSQLNKLKEESDEN